VVKKQSGIMKKVSQYLAEANNICQVEKAILFGSYAAGSANKQSDIDIAIFSREITNENRLEIMTKLIALTGKFRLDIQPVAFPYEDYISDENDFIVNEIKNKGFAFNPTQLEATG
jgi:uncharacterized protein